jgi:hypothetical protein
VPTLAFSWDLLIVIFFAIVMSYSFIMGKQQAVKLILGTYVALIATDGISFALALLSGSGSTITAMGFSVDSSVLALLKVFLFAVFLTLFLARSGVQISSDDYGGVIVRVLSTALLSFSLAGLLTTTVLTSVIGSGFGGALPSDASLIPLPFGRSITEIMISNRALWYGLPALLLVLLGLLNNDT